MTSSKGIATKTTDLETFVEYSLYILSSALACADSSNLLNFLKEFELTLSQIREFFNNSPKRLLFYIKTAHKMHNMETHPDNKRKNVAKEVKDSQNEMA